MERATKAEALLGAITAAFETQPQLAGCAPLNVYMYGSHLHGCAGPKSDYDFIVVVSAPAYFPGIRRVALTAVLPSPLSSSTQHDESEVELDLNIYHEDFFRFYIPS